MSGGRLRPQPLAWGRSRHRLSVPRHAGRRPPRPASAGIPSDLGQLPRPGVAPPIARNVHGAHHARSTNLQVRTAFRRTQESPRTPRDGSSGRRHEKQEATTCRPDGDTPLCRQVVGRQERETSVATQQAPALPRLRSTRSTPRQQTPRRPAPPSPAMGCHVPLPNPRTYKGSWVYRSASPGDERMNIRHIWLDSDQDAHDGPHRGPGALTENSRRAQECCATQSIG